MADMPPAPIRPTRAELMAIFGNAKVVRQFELLFDYLTGTVTDSVDNNTGTATKALTLAEAGRLGIFNPRAPRLPSISAIDGIALARNAAGLTLSADLSYLVPALATYLPRATPRPLSRTPPDEAGSIIATQVFSRR